MLIRVILFMCCLTIFSVAQTTPSLDLTPENISMAQQFFNQSSNKSTTNSEEVDELETLDEIIINTSNTKTTKKLSALESDYNEIDIKQDILIKLDVNQDVTDNVDEFIQLNTYITQFGYDIFSKGKPLSSGFNATPKNYKLNVNDLLTLFIYGKKEQVAELMIDSSGDVFIPGVGPISIINLTLSEANSKIKQSLSQKFTNFKCKLKLNSVEPVSIILSGDVKKPGVYKVNKFQNVIQILANAGGVKKTGSLRSIKRLRYGKKSKTIDLYSFLIYEKLQTIEQFQEGDIIHVPKIGNTIAISGQVKSPGIYEIKRTESIDNAINFASGYRLNAYKNAIYLNRFDSLFKRKTSIMYDDSLTTLSKRIKKEKLQNGDVIYIRSKPNDIYGYVNIMGNVEIPGKYQYEKGLTLKTLISQAKGYKDNSFKTVHVFRYLNNDERQLIQVNSSVKSFQLQDRDIIQVYNVKEFEASRNISIIGEVKNPGDYQFFNDMTLNDALLLSKPLEFASQIDIEVSRFNGEKSTIFYINKNEANQFKLYPGDKISVKLDNLRDQTCVIELKGEFVFPGSYRVNKGTRLADVIKKAGGFTDAAFVKGAIFSRVNVARYDEFSQEKVIEDERKRFIYDQSHLGNLSMDSSTGMAVMMKARQEALNFLEVKTRSVSGRVVLDLYKSNFEFTNDNFIIQDGDVLEIPVQPESVHLIGGVQKSISISYDKSYSLNDYVENVGGYTKYADTGNIYVFKSSGRVFRSHDSIEPGDIVYVPERVIISFNWLQFLTSITQIVSNAVTSIALIRSIQ